ncbi:NAD(P)-binding protein [Pleomassaria siparia CBS 279.74]|uniref:NAD(P)-binding protein n=1 Tax=Pleomassaria siparia CBS 279.74 TaxID=1314801 RepID=A0A6G1JV56_9PLEO|nr:NAD(P)-binding protein [Pleomassaria siparia CBS 279.74]
MATCLPIILRHDIPSRVPLLGTISVEALAQQCLLDKHHLLRGLRCAQAWRLFREPEQEGIGHTATPRLLKEDGCFRFWITNATEQVWSSVPHLAGRCHLWPSGPRSEDPAQTAWSLSQGIDESASSHWNKHPEIAAPFVAGMSYWNTAPGFEAYQILNQFDFSQLPSEAVFVPVTTYYVALILVLQTLWRALSNYVLNTLDRNNQPRAFFSFLSSSFDLLVRPAERRTQDMGLLLDSPLQRVVGRFVPARPPARTFNGQTVLVVGATAGIGLAAAVHFATLGASVIIASRVASRGDAAKWHIEEAAGPSRKGDISCLELDLESYDSSTSFMAKLKRVLPSPAALDVAILNGGIVNSHWEESAAGWKRAVSCARYAARRIGRGGFWDEEPNYAISKLLIMYTIEEISRLARGPDGDTIHRRHISGLTDGSFHPTSPLVIVNSVCPGMVKTDIGQQIASPSWFHNLCVLLTILFTAKSADSGARICVTAALKPKESHGEFFDYWLTPDQYREYVPSENSPIEGAAEASVEGDH